MRSEKQQAHQTLNYQSYVTGVALIEMQGSIPSLLINGKSPQNTHYVCQTQENLQLILYREQVQRSGKYGDCQIKQSDIYDGLVQNGNIETQQAKSNAKQTLVESINYNQKNRAEKENQIEDNLNNHQFSNLVGQGIKIDLKRIPRKQLLPCNRRQRQIGLMYKQRDERRTQVAVEHTGQLDFAENTIEKEIFERSQDEAFNGFFEQCSNDMGMCDKCANGNVAELVCAEINCIGQAFHCSAPSCKCFQMHHNCTLAFPTTMFRNILKKNLDKQKNILHLLYDSEERMIQRIQQNRRNIIKFAGLQGIEIKLLGEIVERSKQKANTIMSNQVLKIMQMISTSHQDLSVKESILASNLKNQEQTIATQCKNNFNTVIQKLNLKQNCVICSKLVKNKQDITFILKNFLQQPIAISLLYRASQHYFNAKKFHQICNEEDRTLTIIKTKPGNLIAAFTPIKWNAKYGNDNSNQTFLLAINVKQRLEHILHGRRAIINYLSEQIAGPSFGGMYNMEDLLIFTDQLTEKCRLRSNFPNTFNWKEQSWRSTFPRSKSCLNTLIGDESGLVDVIDYEVFKVNFRE